MFHFFLQLRDSHLACQLQTGSRLRGSAYSDYPVNSADPLRARYQHKTAGLPGFGKALLMWFTLGLAGLLSGCGNISLPHLIFESPKDPDGQQWQAYEEVTDISHLESAQAAWFKVYVQASLLTQDERQARLLALNSMIGQPQLNQAFLAMEQATLLGVSNAPQKQWNLALSIISKVQGLEADSDAALYRAWLQEELELRLEKIARIDALVSKNKQQSQAIKALQSDVSSMGERISDLNQQINALTNIEQSLSEKKPVPEMPGASATETQ